jgi:hypothetical protein
VPTVKATLLNQTIDVPSFAPDVLALVHIRSAITDILVGKIAITVAVHANWHMRFNNAQYPLDLIKLEIGYPDSQGIMTYRNSGTVVGSTQSGLVMPLIWSEANQQQMFQTAFLKGASADIMARYKILFKVSPALPAGFNDEFVATEKLQLGTQAQDFTLKVSFQ